MNGADMSDAWLKASIVWIDEKPGPGGRPIKEVIYELHDDPDLLRQLDVPADALYSGAKRGDKILVKPLGALIAQDDGQGK